MKTILLTAYAINPYKGSEDGMGWNFVLQAATHNKVIAYTRKNNRVHIEKYQTENPDPRYTNIKFSYFDWPQWLLFWKKGPILSLIYFYFWQLSLALYCRNSNLKFDLAHNLNFHNDWTPSFLWLTGKPMIWGPVGHHPKIKSENLKFYGWKALLSDRFLWSLKLFFWNIDPFLWLTKKKAAHILCMNEDAARVLKLSSDKYTICPSVATDDARIEVLPKNNFTVISAGRYVPLKGFDITLKAFAKFYHGLNNGNRESVKLHLVGSGPFEAKLKQLANELDIPNAVIWTRWIQRNELQKLYAASSVFLFPSYEGAGMVVAEAMVHGLPVVCWDNSGPGAFVSKDTALKVNTNLNQQEAINQFSDRLKKLYTNQAFYELESDQSRKQFLNVFQWNKRGEVLKNVYEETLKLQSVNAKANKNQSLVCASI